MILCYCIQLSFYQGEHQYEILDCVAAKFHEEAGVFKLLVSIHMPLSTATLVLSIENIHQFY